MSAVHEALAYEHERRPHTQLAWACEHPEETRSLAVSPECPGCMAFAMARIMDDPSRTITTSIGQMPYVVWMRRHLDALDPMRVLFERALAARGIG